ncbi:type I-E CRISPR-associated protein Cse2/CasB [Synergistes jonesii]|uniref:type I-E CRISPR-associated protein Cse2/CasB n=1 Tax=Synergistes jonesii TaxID=2754 RepID=UPI0024301FFC|nr:type I-E CRISPR-associated protein Cse2/CasB [Synergistes jonesii]
MESGNKNHELLRKTPDNVSRAVLKRCAGRHMSECTRALGAYYSLKPAEVKLGQEERHFLAVTLACLWKNEERGTLLPLEKCLRRVRPSDSFDHRVMSLLDAGWSDDNDLFAPKLARLVRFVRAEAKGFSPDFEQLYRDLRSWNDDSRYVQKRWARTYFSDNSEEKDTEKSGHSEEEEK